MPVNVTFCTLCDKLNVSGTNSFWEWLCCCLRKKKKAKQDVDEDQDAKIAELEAKIRELEAAQETSSAGSDYHDNLVPPGSFIAVYPYKEGKIKTLVSGAHLHESDISLYNAAREYVVTQGPNLKVFNKEHETMMGKKVEDQDFPKPIKEFVNNMMDYTFQGVYVNVITDWESRLWHFHTHPIYNQHKHKGGEVIGCLFITEPYNKPLMPAGGIDFLTDVSSHSIPSEPTPAPVRESPREYVHPLPVTTSHDHTYPVQRAPGSYNQFLAPSPVSQGAYTHSVQSPRYSPAQRGRSLHSPRVSSRHSPLPEHLSNLSNELD